MEFFANIMITLVVFMLVMFVITLVHEIGHYFVARCIMKEPNVKITMGFFGKPLINTKRFRINAVFFFGGYVGGYSAGESKKSHNIMLFSAGAFFTFLLGVPIALYLSGGSISLGDFFVLFPSSPLREDLFSAPVGQIGFIYSSWLSVTSPLEFFNMFFVYTRGMISILMLTFVVPYAYPLKLHGKWHWNPSDGLWVLKYIFNRVSEKDEEMALAAVNESAKEKQDSK